MRRARSQIRTLYVAFTTGACLSDVVLLPEHTVYALLKLFHDPTVANERAAARRRQTNVLDNFNSLLKTILLFTTSTTAVTMTASTTKKATTRTTTTNARKAENISRRRRQQHHCGGHDNTTTKDNGKRWLVLAECLDSVEFLKQPRGDGSGGYRPALPHPLLVKSGQPIAAFRDGEDDDETTCISAGGSSDRS
jgi:hypothetical protein